MFITDEVTPNTPIALPSAEQGRLAAWLSRVQSGASETVLVSGGLGSGKSTFMEAARREAFTSAFRVGELVLPGLRLFAADGGGGAHPPRVVASGLTSLREFLRVARLASDRWLMTLDDAHLHDPDEIAAVASLVASADTSGVLFLVSASEAPGTTNDRLQQLLARLGAISSTSHHRLGPWTGVDVQELILNRIPALPPAVRFAFELAMVTGGNPALARAYAEHAAGLPEDEQLTVVSGARRLVDLPPPALAVQLVQVRTASLDAEARRILQTLALWALPCAVEELAELTGLPGEAVAATLDALESEGHVQASDDLARPTFEVTDSVVELVLQHGAPSLLAQRVHRRASESLEGRELAPGDQLVRAQHHLAARDLDGVRAGEVGDAAALLLRRGRWDSARAFLAPVVRAAIEQDLPSEVLVRSVRLLAETYARSGDERTAERLIDATRPTNAGSPVGGYLEALQRLASGWGASGRDMEAVSTLRYVAAHPDTPRASQVAAFADLVRLEHWQGRPAHATELARYARQLHEGEADLWLQQALVSRMRGKADESLAEARRAIWLAREQGNRSTAMRSLVAIGEAWLDAESADRAVLWMRGALRRAEREQVFTDVAWIRNRLIAAYIESGDWSNAELAARRGLSFAASLNLPQTSRRSESALAMVQALTGRPWPAYLRTRISATDIANPLILAAVATALYEQQRLVGRHAHARYTIIQAAEMLEDLAGWERLLEIDVLPRLAADHAEHGDVAGVETVVRRFHELAAQSTFTLPISRLELMVAQARLALLQDRPAEAATLLELARAGYQSMDYRWRWALLARTLGEGYVRSGRRARAIETLRSGYVALEQLGAKPEARRVRAELQSLGGRAPRFPQARPTLTPRQTEVAILASRGLSDREIARELGTSVRTTTTHMHTVLKRLGLRSRFEIGAWLQQAGASGAAGVSDPRP